MSCGCGCKGAPSGCGSPARSNGTSVIVLSGTRPNGQDEVEMRDTETKVIYYGALGLLGAVVLGTFFFWKPTTRI